MKKTFLIITISIVIIILIIPLIILERSDEPSVSHDDPNEWLKSTASNWDIEFKKAEKDGYEVSDRGGFFGDGCSFVIARYKDRKKAKGAFPWKNLNSKSDVEEMEAILKILDVKKKNWPEFKSSLLFKQRKQDAKLFIVYEQSKPKNIYVFEDYI